MALTIFRTEYEILDRQYDITDTVLHGVKKFRKSRNGNLDEVRDFLGRAYNLDIKDLDQDVKKFIAKEMKNGILKPSTPKDAKSRNRSRSKRRNHSNSRQTSKKEDRQERKTETAKPVGTGIMY